MKNFLSVLSSALQGGLRGGLLFLALLATTSLWAYDFQSGDLYYNITSDSTVAVTYQEYNSSSNYASISTVTIPETVTYDGTTYSVTSIGDYAFYGCSSLTSITIHKSVTSIRERAFENCSSLTSVTIPNNITRISDRLFFGCSALSSVTIPYGVISIGGSAFSGCSSLTSVTIPNSVKTIVTGAFRDCSALTSITIPEGVTIITNGTFSGCSSLTSVNIPNSVWKIGRSAFANCSSLASITIPNSVGRVESLAFAHCSSLISFTIHENMTNIESNILEGCSSLTAINVDSNNPYYSSVDGVLFNKDRTELKKYPMGKSCSEYTIPNSVTSIGNLAFSNCSSLTSITLPNSVTSIGYYAFEDCSSLTSITIPDSVTSIGDYAFYNCSSLTSVTISEGVTSIGVAAFYNCFSLTSVTIPNSVTSIGDFAFLYCNSLSSATIGNSVTNIGDGAFYCNLEEIYCYPTTPPVVTAKTTFWNYNATLYVPCDSKEAYEEHPVFGEFKNIKGIDDCGGGFVTTHIHDTICQGEVYEFGEYICDTTGTYTAIIGDVTTFLYLTVLPSSIDTITVEAYDSYEWHSVVYTESGTYIYEEHCYQEILHLTIIDTPTPPEPEIPTEGIGVFSIGEGKTVTFSRGNLQYTQSTNTWSFAENQYDYLGTANVSNGALADKIDLFGWSASNTTAPFGVSTSTDWENGYSGSFIDWGTNKIGNDAPNTWRTLTYDEWYYLRYNRTNADNLVGVAQVNGVNGLILLPDNWTCPAGVTFKSGFHSSNGVEYYAAYQTFTADQWSKFEAAGAVFLPAAGERSGSNLGNVQRCGSYWSATEHYSYYADLLYFYSDEARMFYSGYRHAGISVRLVKDINSTTPEPPTQPQDTTIYLPTVYETICEGETYTWGVNGLSYNQAGIYIHEIHAIVEDENYIYRYIHTLELQVLPSSSDTIVVEAYDSYEWHGKVYTESGVHIYEEWCYREILHLTIIDTPTPPEPDHSTEGIGVFSVGEGKAVTFSRGNLQYTQSTNTWSFAENQYDYLGEANIAIDADVLADKIDLFGWSGSTGSAKFGVSTSTDNDDYSGSFVDWGTNQIGSDAPNTWRTLTYDEWIYLQYKRANHNDLVGVAQVNGVNGLIFLPDNWTCPAGVTFKSGFHSSYGVDYYAAYQTFTAEQWSKLESAGAVFLPAAGFRYGSDVRGVQGRGNYWSATVIISYCADYLDFDSDEAGMRYDYRLYGHSVRLVKDISNTTPEPPVEPEIEEIFIYQPVDSVTICASELPYIWTESGMEYTEAGTYTYEEIVEDENYIYHYIHTLELTILPYETIEYEVEAYNSYEWHGMVYTESGVHKYEEWCYQEILHLTIIPSEDNQGEVVVEPSTNSVTITWQKEDDADTYIIVIKQGDKVVCTLIFDAEGNLVSVNYLPGRESNKHGIQHAGLTSDSFQYTITGLTPSTHYTYTVTATDDSDNTISSYSGEFTTHHATSVENTHTQSPTSDCQKILYEDHIYILRDGKIYSIMGQEM